jgi:hypothetical protein
MKKITLLIVLSFIAGSAFAQGKKIKPLVGGSLTIGTIPNLPVKVAECLDASLFANILVKCTGPSNCYKNSGTLPPGATMYSSGMFNGFLNTITIGYDYGSVNPQGTAMALHCFYKYTYQSNGLINISFTNVFTPPAGKTCTFNAAQKAVLCI